MKIVCAACGTRYSIEDSRVAGRSFKFRCKQCARVIVMPGTRAPTAEPAAAGTWHAVIDGMPRPVAFDDLRRLVAAGVLGDRTLVWREGRDDWRELGSVDELRAAGAVSVEIPPEAGMDSTAVDMPKARADAAGDATPEDPPGPAPLRGVRHENSVLFSLGNLARLAAPAPVAASPAGRAEGSGLLDIQSLARSLLPARGERAAAEAGELPVYGALPFSEPIVLIPTPPPRRDRRLVWALVATAGALAVATVILLVVVMRGGTAAHTGTPPVPPAVPGASPAPTAPGGVPAVPATPGTASRAETSAADPTRASAGTTARSADRTGRATTAPFADPTEHAATSPSGCARGSSRIGAAGKRVSRCPWISVDAGPRTRQLRRRTVGRDHGAMLAPATIRGARSCGASDRRSHSGSLSASIRNRCTCEPRYAKAPRPHAGEQLSRAGDDCALRARASCSSTARASST